MKTDLRPLVGQTKDVDSERDIGLFGHHLMRRLPVVFFFFPKFCSHAWKSYFWALRCGYSNTFLTVHREKDFRKTKLFQTNLQETAGSCVVVQEVAGICRPAALFFGHPHFGMASHPVFKEESLVTAQIPPQTRLPVILWLVNCPGLGADQLWTAALNF